MKIKQTLINIHRSPYTEHERVKSFFEVSDNILSLYSGKAVETGDFNINLINENQTTNIKDVQRRNMKELR